MDFSALSEDYSSPPKASAKVKSIPEEKRVFEEKIKKYFDGN